MAKAKIGAVTPLVTRFDAVVTDHEITYENGEAKIVSLVQVAQDDPMLLQIPGNHPTGTKFEVVATSRV